MVDSLETVILEMWKHDEYRDISEETKRKQYSIGWFNNQVNAILA